MNRSSITRFGTALPAAATLAALTLGAAPGASADPSDGHTSGDRSPSDSSCGTSATSSGRYSQGKGTVSRSNAAYSTTTPDANTVLISGGTFNLDTASVTKSGDTSDDVNSGLYGQNAAVLTEYGAKTNLTATDITTDGRGANGLVSTNDGTAVTMTGCGITTSGALSHAAYVANGAALSAHDVTLSTSGEQSAAAATGWADGTLTMTGGSATATGPGSAGLYSTAKVTASDAVITSGADYGAVVDGANSLTLNNDTTSGHSGGVQAWSSGGKVPGTARITVNGGSLDATDGDDFSVEGANADITVQGGATLTASGCLLNAADGSTAALTASGETLSGDVRTDSTSTAAVTLADSSSLSGTLGESSLTLDETSNWNVTGNSVLTSFSDTAGISGTTIANITGNGYTVTYDSSLPANSALDGRTYDLQGGGTLEPAS
jgi:hypothetical protein